MFTGIIEEIGMIKKIEKGKKSSKLTILASRVLEDTEIGDSIAVNGVCLTVTKLEKDSFIADVMAESLRRSNLGELKEKSKVNLERALKLSSRLGGHIVSGHIDGIGIIESFLREENAVWITIKVTKELSDFMVEKGSVTIDGVSLTIAFISQTQIKVCIIPQTQKETILLNKKPKDKVNIECDMIGKYIEKFLSEKKETTVGIDKSFLKEHGFF